MAVFLPRPLPEGYTRRTLSLWRRGNIAEKVSEYPNNPTVINNYESAHESDGYALSFTKGLRHNDNGILDSNFDYECLVEAINRQDATDFTNISRGISEQDAPNDSNPPKTLFSGDNLDRDGERPSWRGWESPRTGHYYDLEGPDSDAVAMPPVPELTTEELIAEMGEVYALALLRDESFSVLENTGPAAATLSGINVQSALNALLDLNWFSGSSLANQSLQERRRRIARFQPHSKHDVNNPPNTFSVDQAKLFRGSGPGAHDGPYVSQYMLMGNKTVKDAADPNKLTGAAIVYGSQEIDQKVSFFPEGLDYMLHWNAYLDVQNGADFGAANITSNQPRRFIDTPRDLATYVRFDQLYQAYLNACLFMLGESSFRVQQPVSGAGPGFPDRTPQDNRQGFASFGGPHVLSLVTEVATRCLKAVRRQKFNYHRRARPERIAALISLNEGALGEVTANEALSDTTRDGLADMANQMSALISLIKEHNESRRTDTDPRPDRNERADGAELETRSHADSHLKDDAVNPLDPDDWDNNKNYLLPMAFAEGSPMHPSYGAGHATVAGGCVTMLKAFFETVDADGTPTEWPNEIPIVRADPTSNGEKLEPADTNGVTITIAGELNKLAANISIGRNMAGVHFYTDYYESSRMGERIATGILIEQLAQYSEPVEMDFHTFDGDHLHMYKGADDLDDVQVCITAPNGDNVDFDVWWTRHLPNDLAGALSVPA